MSKAGPDAGDIARHIRRMTLRVRGEVSPLMALRPGRPAVAHAGQGGPDAAPGNAPARRPVAPAAPVAPEPARPPGWWVLALGEALDPLDFDARERAREALLNRVLRAGVLVDENVWVWDESARAQLVLATLPTVERARRVAERLREKGLAVIVRREMS